jgi:protein subunit release factor A
MGLEFHGKVVPIPQKPDRQFNLIFQIHADGGGNEAALILHSQVIPIACGFHAGE